MIINNFFPKIILSILLLFIGLISEGQHIQVDSTRMYVVDAQAEVLHSPKKATIYSAILPGLGQAYNKKYWKIPLIYAGFGGIGYFIHWNNKNYNIMKSAYNDLTDDDASTDSYADLEYVSYYDLDNTTEYSNFKTNLNKQQDYYRRNRDLLIISAVAFYGLNIIDASVDAHFFDFDISEDLSFNWEPTMQNNKRETFYGLHCTFTF